MPGTHLSDVSAWLACGVGHLCLQARDLRSLGFPPGNYTILVPESLTFLYDMPKWDTLEVSS